MTEQRQITSLFIAVCCAILPALTFSSCNKDGAGDIITRSVPTPEFRFIVIEGTFDVFLIQDTVCSVTFTGEKRIVDRCTAEMSGQTVVLRGSKRGEFLHPNEQTTAVYIHVDTLERINVHEDCAIRTQNALTGNEIGLVVGTRFLDADLELACNVFYYWNNPDGTHLRLTGTTNQLKIWNAGLGSVDASNVTSAYVEVENGSQSDCKVRAIQKLEYSLTSIGNIIYFGNPPELVRKTVDGTGELIKGD